MKKEHIPVLKNEVIKYLDPKPNENFVDCTLGFGGHAIEILKKNAPQGKVLGIEIDPEIFEKVRKKRIERLILVNDSFSNLKKIVRDKKIKEISGILFDLGISSWHIEKSKRGFSFLKNEPLWMRYDAKKNLISAEEIINFWPENKIERILREFGQEKFAKKIAKALVKERKERKITTTRQLVEIVKKAVPLWYLKRRIHFATKTFLALRIAVNEELKNLEKSLPQALEILKKGGRLVVISFHSLEDKIVKKFLKEKEKEGKLKILTKKPIVPSPKEIKKNKRARSAKLRAAVKI